MHKACLQSAGSISYTRGKPTGLLMAAVLSASSLLAPAVAASQSIGYTVAPAAQYINWGSNFGLDDATLYGGRVGLTFGGLVGLQGFYMTNSGVSSSLGGTGLAGPGGSALLNQDVRLRTYGADLLVDIGRSNLRPFMKAGGAIMNFSPREGEESDQIALNYGGGIRFGGPGSVQVQLSVQDWLLRSNRFGYAIPDPASAFDVDPDREKIRHNLAFGASLNVPIGGQNSAGADDRWNFGPTLPLEIFAGRLQFDETSGLANQNVAGVRAGVDFGSLVGLRGYYWRGAESGFDSPDPIQSWGGEAQFNLNTGPGISPFLLAGAGRVNFLGDYRDESGFERDDKTVLILGGGLGMQLTEALRLNFSARDYLFGQRNLADVSSPDELRSNWMFTGGVAFRIGRNSRDSRSAPAQPVFATEEEQRRYAEFERMERARAAREGMTAGELERVEMERNRAIMAAMHADPQMEMHRQQLMLDEMTRQGGRESLALRTIIRDELERDQIIKERDQLRRERDELLRAWTGGAQTVPAPQVGTHINGMPRTPQNAMTQEEMINYIDSAVSRRVQSERDSMRLIIRDEFTRFMKGNEGTTPPAVTQEMVSAMVRAEMSRVMVQPGVVDLPDERVQQQTGVTQTQRQWQGHTWSAYSGFTLNSGSQIMLGLRANVGRISANSPIALVPELAFGFGSGGTSVLVAANANYRVTNFNAGGLGIVSPYVALGLGLLNFSEPVAGHDGLDLVVNPAWGAAVRVGRNSGVLGLGAPEFFVEHQGIALFDINRLLAGLRWAF